MSVPLYMDEHVQGAITDALRAKGVDVLTVQEDGMTGEDDVLVLDRAAELGRVVFTRDADFLAETTRRLRTGAHFNGVVYGHQLRTSVWRCIDDLERIALASDPDDCFSRLKPVFRC